VSQQLDGVGQWRRILGSMLLAYREARPGDGREVEEILSSFMDGLVATGAISRSGGKYMVPRFGEATDADLDAMGAEFGRAFAREPRPDDPTTERSGDAE
jgi:hypothetical protein